MSLCSFVMKNIQMACGNKKVWDIILFLPALPFCPTVMNVFMYICMYAFLSLCIFLVSSPPHHSADLLLLQGLQAGPLSFSNNITGHSARPAQQEVRSSWLWNSLILKGFWFLLPAPVDTAFAFTLGPVNHGLRSLPHLPNIVSALSKWWQVGVEELSGPAILRKEGVYGGKYYHRKHMRSKGWESFGVLDYICQGNETEQKLSNIKLFKCIPRVLNTAFFSQRLRADSDYIFSLWGTCAKCDICEVASKTRTPTFKKKKRYLIMQLK